MKLALALAIVLASAARARADKPNDAGAAMAAAAWTNAAAKGAMDDAVAMTGTPFWYDGAIYADAAAKKACAKIGARGTVSDAAKVAPVLACLAMGTAPLLDAAASWDAIEPPAIPSALAAQRKKLVALAKTHTLVLAHAKAGKVEDWAVFAVRAQGTDAFVDAYVAAHRGR
ncbi:MAG TPA: hypothetical protein VL463_27390 [Kofleriaceae bacterium]|jgi:hypothetical protein|nr:hypothetical protein [Kofleriaceae bacterium]